MKRRRRKEGRGAGGREPVVALALPGVDVKRNHLLSSNSIQLSTDICSQHNNFLPSVEHNIQMLLSM